MAFCKQLIRRVQSAEIQSDPPRPGVLFEPFELLPQKSPGTAARLGCSAASLVFDFCQNPNRTLKKSQKPNVCMKTCIQGTVVKYVMLVCSSLEPCSAPQKVQMTVKPDLLDSLMADRDGHWRPSTYLSGPGAFRAGNSEMHPRERLPKTHVRRHTSPSSCATGHLWDNTV